MTAIIVQDLFPLTTYQDDKKKIWDIDPLVLAVSLKDIADKTGIILNLENPDVKENVNQTIIDQAEIIRKYYTKKFFWKNLSSNRQLSNYRIRLCHILESRTLETKDRDTGIFFKLPWFYQEDMIYEEFRKKFKTTDISSENESLDSIRSLSFLRTTLRWQNKRKIEHLWFKDDCDYLYSIILEKDNPLIETFYNFIKDSEFCKFKANYKIDRIDNLYFYKLNRFTLIEVKRNA